MSTIRSFVSQFEKEPTTGPRPRMRKAKQLSAVDVALDDARRRAASGDWETAKGSTLVGLYALCHQMIYGVVPSELMQDSVFRIAAKLAAKQMHELFRDDPTEVAAFVRWAWEREKGRVAWAQSKSIDRNRMGWKAQFSRAMETDYRVSRTQRAQRR